jgi:hypothetical protein
VTRALVWKELREQWVVWLAVALVAAGGVAALHTLMSPSLGCDQVAVGVLWLAAWGYGLVCGSLLFAVEAEEGTQSFLDTLPGTRRQRWRIKAGVGLALLAAQTGLLAAIDLVWFFGRHIPGRMLAELAGLLFLAPVGFAWGLYSGTRDATVLTAIARGGAVQVVAGLALYPFTVMAGYVLAGRDSELAQPLILAVLLGLIAVAAAVRSRELYELTDRQRGLASRLDAAGVTWLTWGETVRLAFREVRLFAAGMALVGVLGAVAVALFGVIAWPVTTAFLGMLCGLAATAKGKGAGEAGGASGELATAGRRTFVRAVLCFAVAVVATFLASLVPFLLYVRALEADSPLALGELEERLPLGITANVLTQPILFVTFWVVAGFAAGSFCGLSVRSRRRAVSVAVVATCLFAGVWLPAVFLADHPRAWQVWGPPLVLLAGFVLVRGARSRKRVLAAGAGLVAGLWLAAALWYRATEIPSPPDAVDVESYRASLPDPSQNEAGRLTGAALRRVREIVAVQIPAQPAGRFSLSELIRRVGRSDADAVRRLGKDLDRAFADPWSADLARAAEQPPGILVDPREAVFTSRFEELSDARDAAVLLIARGLQRQVDGDPAAFVDYLRTGLALARTLRHRSISFSVVVGDAIEARMASAVVIWLARLEGHPELLRRTLDVLREHASAPGADDEDARKADYLVALYTLARPDWTGATISHPFSENVIRRGPTFAEPPFEHIDFFIDQFMLFTPEFPRPQRSEPGLWIMAPSDADLVGLSLAAPWEQARLRHALARAEAAARSAQPAEDDSPRPLQYRFGPLGRSFTRAELNLALESSRDGPALTSWLDQAVGVASTFLARGKKLREWSGHQRDACGQATAAVAKRLVEVENGRQVEKPRD